MKTPIRFLLPLLCAAVASLQSVDASTFLVTNNGDNGGVNPAPDAGTGTLRQAIVDANANAGPDMITFSPGVTGTILLLSVLPNLSDDVIITGPGANVLAVDGNHANRVFYINPGLTVTISGLTITNGAADHGAGIYNDHATLTVSNSTLTGNNAGNLGDNRGGGIFNDHATLTVSNSTLTGNSASSNDNFGTGGGISNILGTVTVTNSTVSGNSTSGISNGGGGIYNGHGTLTVTNSTVSGNSGTLGGGIYSEVVSEISNAATVTVTNSTVSGNSASDPSGGFGGGIFNAAFNDSGGNVSATVTVTNSTLSGNSAGGAGSGGGGIYNALNVTAGAGNATVTIGSTIINAGSSGENIRNDSGTVTSQGYNLSSDNGGGYLTNTGDQINTDPMLAPLANNGGPTFTHALSPTSPAIDKGKNFSGSTTDQRGTGFGRTVDLGFPKPTGGDGTDIGAYEVQALPPCPKPQGYWKNNPNAWPVSALPMTLGSQQYTQADLLRILRTPTGSGTKADASLILADQLIAANLNIANGADRTPVTSTIADADAVLSIYPGKLPYHVRTNTTNGHRMVNDANVLNNYNNGLLTSGCTP